LCRRGRAAGKLLGLRLPAEETDRDSIPSTAAEVGSIGQSTQPEGLREGTEPESRAPLGVFAETLPDFTPPLPLREETEALGEETLDEFTAPAPLKEGTTALLEGTFPLFTRPVAKALPLVALIYPPPL